MLNLTSPWTFDFTPNPSHPDPLPIRVADMIRDAQAAGLNVVRVRLETAPADAVVPPENAARKLLKSASRRHGMKAEWPEPDRDADRLTALERRVDRLWFNTYGPQRPAAGPMALNGSEM